MDETAQELETMDEDREQPPAGGEEATTEGVAGMARSPTGRKEAAGRSRVSPGWWIVSALVVLTLLVVLRAYLGVEGLVREVIALPEEVVEQWKTALPSPPTPTVVVLPPALEQVRSLAHLQTTRYFLSTVVEAERPPDWPGTGQRLLLVAYGTVTAGVDLSQIGEKDVEVIGRRVILHLPDPEVMDVFLDEEGTYVYDYEKGLFARYDTTLEAQARQRALEEFRRTALENGILEEARRRAEWEVQRLLLLLGYESVDFR